MTGKKNKNQKTTAIVVYQPKTTGKKKKNGKGKALRSLRSSNNDLDVYRAALLDPFSLKAQGARVPDMYCVPTTTRHITKTFTIATNAGGECDVIVLPSAYMHALSTRGSLVDGGAWNSLDGGSSANATQYTLPSTLATQLVNHRIVGYGVKVMGISNLMATAGKVQIATLPISSYVNDKGAAVGGQVPNINDTNGTKPKTLDAYGIPNSNGKVDIGALLSMPNSMETSLAHVTGSPLTVVPKISSPEAFNFKLSADSGIGFNITDQTSTSYVSAGDASYLRLAGHEAVIIAGSCMPASVNTLEIEVVYHLEGSPYQLAAGWQVIGNDSQTTVVNPVGFMQVIQQVAQLPAFRRAVETTGNSVLPGLGSLANRMY